MMVEKGLDTGDVLYEVEVKISENDDYLSLSEKLSFAGAEAILEVLKNFEKYFSKRKKQNNSEVSYVGLIKKEMGLISWEDTAFENYNKVRGLKVWPGAFFSYDDVFVKVYEAETDARRCLTAAAPMSAAAHAAWATTTGEAGASSECAARAASSARRRRSGTRWTARPVRPPRRRPICCCRRCARTQDW